MQNDLKEHNLEIIYCYYLSKYSIYSNLSLRYKVKPHHSALFNWYSFSKNFHCSEWNKWWALHREHKAATIVSHKVFFDPVIQGDTLSPHLLRKMFLNLYTERNCSDISIGLGCDICPLSHLNSKKKVKPWGLMDPRRHRDVVEYNNCSLLFSVFALRSLFTAFSHPSCHFRAHTLLQVTATQARV